MKTAWHCLQIKRHRERLFAMLFVKIRSHFNARASEWVLACIMTSIGLMFLRPTDLFGNSEAYFGLARIASQGTWGWFCFACGALRLAALTVNGSWVPSTYHLRAITSLLSCFFWFQISIALMISDQPSMSLGTFPWLLALDLICCHRAAGDAQRNKLLDKTRV